jgi:hypothetical protein
MNWLLDIREQEFSASDRVFLDANIILMVYVFASVASKTARVYVDSTRRIREAKGMLFVDVIVLSEVINRLARKAWQKLVDNGTIGRYPDGSPFDFKKFRDSDAFKPIAEEIVECVLWILE